MGTDNKDEALRVLFEVTSLIEVLWNQMIAFETLVIYKNHTKDHVFSRTLVKDMDDALKGFDSFFNSRTYSYSMYNKSVLKVSY